MTEERRARHRSLSGWRLWLLRAVLLAVVVTPAILWPKGLAITLSALLVTCLAVYWWIRYKIRKFTKPFRDFELFPTQVKVTKQRRPKIHNDQAVSGAESKVAELDFVPVGYFTVDNMPGVTMSAFIHRDEQTFGVVYDQEFLEPWMDFICEHSDGSNFTVSNTSMPSVFDDPPDKPIVRIAGEPPAALFRAYLDQRPGKERRRLSGEIFASSFERYFAERAAWQQEEAEQQEELDQEIREAFLRKSQWTAIEWDRNQERVIFLHQNLKSWEVAGHLTGSLNSISSEDFEKEERQAEKLAGELAPIAAFEEILASSAHGQEFEKLMELSEPVPVHVYLGPELDEDDEWEE